MNAKKIQVGRELKAVKSDGPDFLMYIEGYASTKDVDRVGDTIEPSAWAASMADYMKHPVLLVNHVWSDNPVGKVLEYRIDDVGLWIRAGIAPTMAGREVVTLIEMDIFTAFSVGFNIKKYEKSSDESEPFRIIEAELLEISVVSVPANMSALFEVAAGKGITLKHLITEGANNGRKQMDPDKVKEVVDPIVSPIREDVDNTKAKASELERQIGALTKITNEIKDAAKNGTKTESELREQVDRMATDTARAIEDLNKEVKRVEALKRPGVFANYGNPQNLTLKSLIHRGDAELKSTFGATSIYPALKELQRLNDACLWYDAMKEAESMSNNEDYHRLPRAERMKSSRLFRELNEFAKAMDIATSTEGSELVPTEYSGQLEDMVRLELKVAPLFRQIQMPQSPFKLPVHTADTEAKLIGETKTVISAFDSNEETPTSTNVTFTASKARSRIQVSREITEDAVIAILPYVQECASRGIAIAIDEAIINGDNGTTHFDTGYTVGATDFRRAWDGLRYHFQATLSAHGIDASTFNEAKLDHIRSEMGKYGVYPSNLVYLAGVKSYLKKLMGLDNLQTLDKYGPNAVVLTGEVLKYAGVPVIVSEYMMENLNDSGIYDATTTDKGEILIVNRNAWALGHYKPITVETVRDAINDVYTVVAFKRCDFEPMYTPTATTGVIVNSAYRVTYT